MSLSPYTIAVAHQTEIRRQYAAAQVEAACIKQIMAGRTVRVKRTNELYLVTGVLMSLSGTVTLRGKTRGARNAKAIGSLADVDLVERTPEP